MVDEYEKYRKPDGDIDWGAYSTDKVKRELEEPERKIIELEDLRIFKLADELSDYRTRHCEPPQGAWQSRG